MVDIGNEKTFEFNMLYKVMDIMLYKEYENFKVFFKKNKEKYTGNLFGLLTKYSLKYLIYANIVIFFR